MPININYKKLITLLIIIAFSSVCLCSCVSSNKTQTPAQTPAQTQEPPQNQAQEKKDLISLITQNDTDGVKAYLQTAREVNKSANSGDYNGLFPIHIATKQANIDILNELLETGAKVDEADINGRTALYYALSPETGKTVNKAIVEKLIHNGASLFSKDKDNIQVIDKVNTSDLWQAVICEDTILDKDKETGETVLHAAAKALSKEAVNKILSLKTVLNNRFNEYDQYINAQNSNGESALDVAFKNANSLEAVNILELLVKADIESNEYTRDNKTFSVFKSLIKTGNSDLSDDETSLHVAVSNNQLGFLQYFINRKDVDINQKIKRSSETALYIAVKNKNMEAIKILLNNGADVSIINDKTGISALHLAFFDASQEEMISTLLEKAPNLANCKDSNNDSLLHLVVRKNISPSYAQILINEKGISIDAPGKDGETALLVAVKNNNDDYIKFLTQNKASVFVENLNEESALSFALNSKDKNLVIKLLSEYKAQAIYDEKNNSVYHVAINCSDPEMITVLKEELEFDPSQPNREGDTALHIAIRENKDAFVEKLIALGANVFAVNSRRESPVSIALNDTGKYEGTLVKLLNKQDENGNTALHSAALAGMSSSIDFLTDNGLSLYEKNSSGEIPLELAARSLSPDTIKKTMPTDINEAQESIARAVRNSIVPDNATIAEQNQEEAIESVLMLSACLLDKDSKDSSGKTALHLVLEAVKDLYENNPTKDELFYKQEELLKYNFAVLLDGYEDDLSKMNLDNKKPLFKWFVETQKKYPSVAKQKYAQATTPDKNIKSPLHIAAEIENPVYIKILADRANNLEIRDKQGKTPLFIAIESNNLEVAKELLAKGASIYTIDDKGSTPLVFAMKNNTEMFKAILESKASKTLNTEGKSIITVMLNEGNVDSDLFTLAVKAGVPIDRLDINGKAPLHIAIEKNYFSLASILVDSGADIFSRDKNNNMAISMIFKKGAECIKAVFNADNINKLYYTDETALHRAASENNLKAVETLLSLNANPKITNRLGETAYDIAVNLNNTEIAELLK